MMQHTGLAARAHLCKRALANTLGALEHLAGGYLLRPVVQDGGNICKCLGREWLACMIPRRPLSMTVACARPCKMCILHHLPPPAPHGNHVMAVAIAVSQQRGNSFPAIGHLSRCLQNNLKNITRKMKGKGQPADHCIPHGAHIVNFFAHATGKRKSAGLSKSVAGLSLRKKLWKISCLTHVQRNLQYNDAEAFPGNIEIFEVWPEWTCPASMWRMSPLGHGLMSAGQLNMTLAMVP